MIVPTPGRIVWFKAMSYMPSIEGQPLAAIVVAVQGDELVNLAVFDINGNIHQMQNIKLIQDYSEPEPGECCWMLYQKAVAKGEIPLVLHADATAKLEAITVDQLASEPARDDKGRFVAGGIESEKWPDEDKKVE